MSEERGSLTAMPWWVRAPIALFCGAALALLARERPPLPPFARLFASQRPWPEEDVRETIALLAWLLAAVICLVIGWLMVEPIPRAETTEEPDPPPLRPATRRSQPPRVYVPPSRELLALFAAPRAVQQPAPAELVHAIPISPTGGPTRPTSGEPLVPERPRMLRLYGPLSIDGSDGVGLSQRPTRGLIAYLALKSGPVDSAELSEALWPGEPPAKTRTRLWKARTQAQALLGDALQRRRDGFQLDRRRLRCDRDELERLQHGQPDPDRLEQALALIGGEPLIDIDYPWADSERRRLQALLVHALTQTAVARLENGNPTGALVLAEKLIEFDALDEEGWRLAMHAEAALGQRQALLDR